MPRVVTVRGKRYAVPLPPSHVQYLQFLRSILARVRDGYIALAAERAGAPAPLPALPARRPDVQTPGRPDVRTDAKRTHAERLLGTRRKPFYNVLQETDRSRRVSEHGINAIVSSVVNPEELSPLLDHVGRSIISHGSREFDATVRQESVFRGTAIPEIHARDIADTAEELIDGFRDDNLSLITALVRDQVDSLEDVLEQNAGAHVEDMTTRIQQATGATESHAQLLARDQTLKLNSNVQQVRAENVGATQYTWITSNDERVRGRPGGKWERSQSNHWELQGQTFAYGEPPITNPVTGARNNPGEDFQCRCTAVPDLSHIFGDGEGSKDSQSEEDGE